MRALGLAIGAGLVMAANAAAADARFDNILQMLAPAERLEQLCDYTAMAQIRNDDKNYSPDRAVANAMVAAGQTGHYRDQGRRLPQPRQMVQACL